MAGAQAIDIYLFVYLFESRPHKDPCEKVHSKAVQIPSATGHATRVYVVTQCKKKLQKQFSVTVLIEALISYGLSYVSYACLRRYYCD